VAVRKKAIQEAVRGRVPYCSCSCSVTNSCVGFEVFGEYIAGQAETLANRHRLGLGPRVGIT
jgi:hypothetical protein